MAHGDTFKMIKLVGESSQGIEDAVKTALDRSSDSVRDLSWAHVVDVRLNLGPDGSIQAWQATLEAAFKVGAD